MADNSTKIVKRGGFWFPAYDRHFGGAVENYQREIYDLALPHIKGRGVALDIGAHVGIWSRRMSKDFATVYAFEPNRHNLLCLVRNAAPNVFLSHSALGRGPGTAYFSNPSPENSGAWETNLREVRGEVERAQQDDRGSESVEVVALDSFNLSPDFIKIDTQGSECDILRGAAETIQRCRPVLIVEHQLRHHNGADIREIIHEYGGKVVATHKRDAVVVF